MKHQPSTKTGAPNGNTTSGNTKRRPEQATRASPDADDAKDTDRLSLRDPQEPSEGPLRLDDLNYSAERLTLPEGNYNVYADDEASSLDEDAAARAQAHDAQYPENSQREIIDTLPEPGETIGDDRQRQSGDRAARNDLAILDIVNDLLADVDESEAAAIEVTVKDGLVLLEGNVAEAATRHRLEQAIEAIPGVEEVRNQLAIRGACEPPRWSDT